MKQVSFRYVQVVNEAVMPSIFWILLSEVMTNSEVHLISLELEEDLCMLHCLF